MTVTKHIYTYTQNIHCDFQQLFLLTHCNFSHINTKEEQQEEMKNK